MSENKKNPHQELDNLLTPSIQHLSKTESISPKPWRLASQLWVAFFGGILAYGYIAYKNSERLGEPRNARQRLVLVTIAGFILTVIVNWLFMHTDILAGAKDGTLVRLSSRIVAVLAYLLVKQWQTTADHAHQFTNRGYASLWKPGLIATLGLGFLQNIIVWAITR